MEALVFIGLLAVAIKALIARFSPFRHPCGIQNLRNIALPICASIILAGGTTNARAAGDDEVVVSVSFLLSKLRESMSLFSNDFEECLMVFMIDNQSNQTVNSLAFRATARGKITSSKVVEFTDVSPGQTTAKLVMESLACDDDVEVTVSGVSCIAPRAPCSSAD